MSLRAGVIGVGYLGRHHARVYSGLDGVRLSAVSDTDASRAGEISGLYGAALCADFREMLPLVDAVSIVTPTETHFEIALECLRAGKDVLVEKPMTCTVAEADLLIEEARKRGAVLQIGHLERFNPTVEILRSMIEEPVFFDSERLSPYLERASGVDVTVDLMIHDIDIVMSLMGSPEIKDMRAAGAKVLSEKLDTAKAWIEFRGGGSALFTASRLSEEKRRTLRVLQKNSYIVLDYQGMEIKRHLKEGGRVLSETVKAEGGEPLGEELRDFVECIRTRRRPKVTGREGREALKTALEITERIRDGSR